MTETIMGYDKKEMIKHIYRYRCEYKTAWVVLLLGYAWLLIQSIKYVGYIFLPLPTETRMLIGALWMLCLAATNFVVYTGVWIVLIEPIYKKNIGGNKRK